MKYSLFTLRSITYFIKLSILSLTVMFPICAKSTPAEINRSLEFTPNLKNGEKIFPLCASCHMKNGWGKKDGSFPVIAGQHRNVLIKQLWDIRTKKRDNPTMYPFADPMEIGGAQGVSDVTAYISSLARDPSPGTGNGKHLSLGKKIFNKQCVKCHGALAEGSNEAFFPRLKGQHYIYLFHQLKWIRDGYRKNSNAGMLAEIKSLSDDDLAAVADYISRL